MVRPCPHCGGTHSEQERRCPTTGMPVGADPGLLGAIISDRYHLVRLLGDGGMGAVYKAGDRVLRRFVALKLLHKKAAAKQHTVERFVREARSAAGIGHPNIIDIIDFGYEDERPFLVMEYLRGRPLSQLVANEGPLAIDRACRIATHTLAGLDAAHEHSILHRDLKPANLMLVAHLGDKDFVKICDFGFATLLSPQEHIADDGRVLTPDRVLVGTPSYAAPERLRGDDRRDPRIDIWSLGVVLFEMLTGQRPFKAPRIAELAKKIRKADPPTMRSLRPDIPEQLDRVVARALAKDPDGRWPSARAFADALVPFGGRRVEHEERTDTERFSMDLIKVRARETARWRVLAGADSDAVLRANRPPEEPAPARQRPADFRPDAVTNPPPPPDAQPARVEEAPTERDAPPAAETGGSSSLRRLTRPVPPYGDDADTDVAHSLPAEGAAASPPVVPQALEAGGPQAPAASDTSQDAAAQEVAAPVAAQSELDDPSAAFESSVVLPVLRFVSQGFGERALKDVLDALPGPARDIFASGVSSDSWVPWYAVNALVQEVDARLGRDDLHLIAQCGHAAAEGAFDRIRMLKSPVPPPELLLAELPSTMQQVLWGTQWRVHHVGRGYGRLEVVEQQPASLPTCVWSLGFLEESLDRVGAKDIEVNLTSCRALGDPSCVLDVTWL